MQINVADYYTNLFLHFNQNCITLFTYAHIYNIVAIK